ncbi:universal stress protein [Piscinibacter sp. XHJ-5]|uniref:universal stress protein n=1 Tax=Piscinibacter sp. XHJ-5 TaxID=3037797 RepID=UPI0024530051|nr:universal stress protein [Piscinibacter sp. XHJ-5]
MAFRSLLVFLDGDARCDARSHLAARFAAAHDSHLLGIAPTGALELSGGFAAASHRADEAAASRADAVHRAGERVDRFVACCKLLGVASMEAHVHEGEKAQVLLHHAHCADLTVIGQADPASASHREEKRFVEQVLLANPRPTLVVPHAGRFDVVGERVVVAWDDSHGCARAVADALPLLRQAQAVHLRLWRRIDEGEEHPLRERMQAVSRWLMRQGVSADVEVATTDANIGEAILREALATGADLVVMGSYGHSRWTERLLGGATRTALVRSPVPLLMSH